MLDELGAGTDPEEGAALGIALLDWLRERGSLVLADDAPQSDKALRARR